LIKIRGRIHRNLRLIRLNPISNLPSLENFCLKEPQREFLLKALVELEFKSLIAYYQNKKQSVPDSHQAMLF